MNIPFVDLKTQYKSIQKHIDAAIARVIEEAHFIQGEDVRLFEEEFASYIGVKRCISLNSGTDALILGIRALELSPDSEILVPVNTFIATALGISENRLKPVFVDVDPSDYGMDLDDLKRKITNKTKAILPVHLYGQPEKLDEIRDIIRKTKREIYLIEDACQAHGAKYKGETVGSFGIFSAFSYYPGKNLGAYGDGGALVTDDNKLAEKVRLLREYGARKKYVHDSLGINSRMDTIQAAILRVKLHHLDAWNKKRQHWASRYTSELSDVMPRIRTPEIFSDRASVYHLYVIEVEKRDELLTYLNKNGVQSLIHYPTPLHLQKAYGYLGYKKGDFPKVENMANRILSLPMHPDLTEEQIQYVVSLIKKFYKK
jgi:dTDP-4-amino-4,6-dideoxygalactose transaminase